MNILKLDIVLDVQYVCDINSFKEIFEFPFMFYYVYTS